MNTMAKPVSAGKSAEQTLENFQSARGGANADHRNGCRSRSVEFGSLLR